MPTRRTNKKLAGAGVIVLPNSDKDGWREKAWSRDPLEIRRPFRLAAVSGVGGGKTLLAKNIGIRREDWKKVVVWSPHAADGEWGDADPTEFCKQLPSHDDATYWGPITEPCLLIADDVMLTRSALGKQYDNVDKVFSFCSTHHNWSIILCAQVLSQMDLSFKRYMNVWCLWQPRDKVAALRLATIAGLSKQELETLFSRLTGPHDFAMIDSSGTETPGLQLRVSSADGISAA